MTAEPLAAAARVIAFVDDPESVSPAQRDAVVHSGGFFLTACPGSGKTRTVGVRLAYQTTVVDPSLGRPRRVAATSFTNTAVREIVSAAERAGKAVQEPNFVGTLHRFLIRYVVRPFAAPVMDTETRPRIITDPTRRDLTDESINIGRIKTPIPIWDFHWRPDGSLSLEAVPFALRGNYDAATLESRGQEQALEVKHRLAAQGLLSFSDALYWAMKTLENEGVAAVVARRFDELIVDEVQDTGDVQQRCIELLIGAGLHSAVLVGDMEQAIYGFAHAKPDELEAFVSSATSVSLQLAQNWRSSQAICDVAHRFSAREMPDEAVGPHRDLGHVPEILTYDGSDPQAALSAFLERLSVLSIDHEQSIVLCRWSATVDQLGGVATIKLGRSLRVFVSAASAVQNGDQLAADDIRAVEAFILTLARPDAELDDLGADERLEIRLRVTRMLAELPSFDTAAKDWVNAARIAVKAVAEALLLESESVKVPLRAPTGAGTLTMGEIVGELAIGPHAQTIHSVKGESHAATLLIAVDDPNMPSLNTASWIGRGDPEESRVAYVALTRAQQYSAVALPAGTSAGIEQEYLNRGFVAPDSSTPKTE